jgi:hypothetical protein
MCMYVRICTYLQRLPNIELYVCMYVCVYACISGYNTTQYNTNNTIQYNTIKQYNTHIHIHTQVHSFCVCMYVCMHVCMHACFICYACICMYTYATIYMHTITNRKTTYTHVQQDCVFGGLYTV